MKGLLHGKSCAVEFHVRAIALVRAGKSIADTARDQTVFRGDTIVATGSRWVLGEDFTRHAFDSVFH